MKNRRVRSTAAFAELFEQHVDGVFETAWLIVRDREVAADITEQTFAEGWAQFHRTPREMFEMWLLARSRDRAFNWLYVHHPDGLDPDQLARTGSPGDASLGRLLRARVARNLRQGQVPIRAEPESEPAHPGVVAPPSSDSEVPPLPEPPEPPLVGSADVPPLAEPTSVAPAWPLGWKESAPAEAVTEAIPVETGAAVGSVRRGPAEQVRAAVSAWMARRRTGGTGRGRRGGEDRTEVRRQRLAGVAVGAAVGLALIVALRVDDGPQERAASRTSAPEAPEEQPHQHTTTTAPPPSTQLVAATQPTTPPTTRKPTPTTTPPPPAPPTTKPQPPVISDFHSTLVDNMSCGYDPNTMFDRRMVMTWTASGGTSGRIRPEGGPWVPVSGSSGSYEVCGRPGVRWYLEIANAGGTASSSTVPGMFPGPPPYPPPAAQPVPWTVPQASLKGTG